MANATHASLLPQIAPYLPQAERPALLDLLRDAARRFFEQSGALTERVALTTVQGQASYALSLQTEDCEAFSVRSVRPVDSEGPLEEEVSPHGYRLDHSGPSLVFLRGFVPSQSGETLEAEIVIVPSRSGYGAPAWALARWGRGIAALAGLSAVEMGLSQASPQQAEAWRGMHRAALADARIYAETQGVERDLSFGA